jgi:hypothetical protein
VHAAERVDRALDLVERGGRDRVADLHLDPAAVRPRWQSRRARWERAHEAAVAAFLKEAEQARRAGANPALAAEAGRGGQAGAAGAAPAGAAAGVRGGAAPARAAPRALCPGPVDICPECTGAPRHAGRRRTARQPTSARRGDRSDGIAAQITSSSEREASHQRPHRPPDPSGAGRAGGRLARPPRRPVGVLVSVGVGSPCQPSSYHSGSVPFFARPPASLSVLPP